MQDQLLAIIMMEGKVIILRRFCANIGRTAAALPRKKLALAPNQMKELSQLLQQ